MVLIAQSLDRIYEQIPGQNLEPQSSRASAQLNYIISGPNPLHLLRSLPRWLSLCPHQILLNCLEIRYN